MVRRLRKSLASSLCAISSFILATRVIIEQAREKCQLVSQDFDETANWIYERESRNWQQTYRFSDGEKENTRRRRGWKDFRTNHFSRLFDKLLLCSTTLLPLEWRTSNRREGRKEERGTRPICESVLHKIARLLETSVCLCVRRSGTWIHLEAWLDSAWKKRRKKHG